MDTQSIGNRIQICRGAKNWTQEDLSNASGVTEATISRLENGHHKRRPNVETVQKLADALEVEAGWLLVGDLGLEGKEAA